MHFILNDCAHADNINNKKWDYPNGENATKALISMNLGAKIRDH